VRQRDGSAIGTDVGLVRSTGGNLAAARETGHLQWDSTFDSWDAYPPADAGSVTSSATAVGRGSPGITIAFTYTAPSTGLRNGSVSIAVPDGWTAPVTTATTGCTTATAGLLTTTDQTIVVSALTLPPNGQIAITYGATSGDACAAGDGATAASSPGAPIWQVQVVLSDGGPFTNLPSSPSIDVEPG
jgi:hypothetical protein